MIRKSVSQLSFVNSASPLPTVEVDTDSIERAGLSTHDTALLILTQLAEQDSSLRATLYMYAAESFNFHEPTWSEFLLVAGPNKVLQALGAGFGRLPTVKSRFSDYVSSVTALRAFHVEGGLVWEQEDALTWYSEAYSSVELAAEDEESQEDSLPIEEDEDGDDLEDEEVEVEEELDTDQTVAAVERRAARYRAARSDARVSSIRAAIEEVFGLPAGSVALCGPDRRALRGDARIRTLRKRWEDS